MKIIILTFALMAFILPCFCETIVLKSGKSVEGKIVEKTKDYVKVEVAGMGGQSLTYFLSDIADIKQNPNAKSEEPVKITVIGSTVIKNQNSTVYTFYQLDTAKQKAKTESKPIVFLFTEMSTRCPKARAASSSIIRNFQDNSILVNIEPQKLAAAPKALRDALLSGKGGNMLPVTVIMNSQVSEVIDILPYSTNSTYQGLFQKANAAIEKYKNQTK